MSEKKIMKICEDIPVNENIVRIYAETLLCKTDYALYPDEMSTLLRYVLKRLAHVESRLPLEHKKPDLIDGQYDLAQLLGNEDYRVAVALDMANQNRKIAAEILGVTERTLYRKIKDLWK